MEGGGLIHKVENGRWFFLDFGIISIVLTLLHSERMNGKKW